MSLSISRRIGLATIVASIPHRWKVLPAILSTLLIAPSASAIPRSQEFPYGGSRFCIASYRLDSIYKLDYCSSVGKVRTQRFVGQITLACRNRFSNAPVRCRTLTNNLGHFRGYNGKVLKEWVDSVPNVYRYVSHSEGYSCTRGNSMFTDAIQVSARFPDNKVVYSPITLRSYSRVCD